jgi:hypothetical protein
LIIGLSFGLISVMDKSRVERGLLIGGVPGKGVYYVGFPKSGSDARVKGIKGVVRFMESVNQSRPKALESGLAFVAVGPEDQALIEANRLEILSRS